MFLRRMDEAVALCAEAARLDPRSPLVARRYATVLWEAGRLHAVDSVASLALRTVPDNLALVQLAAGARLHQGDLAGARAVLREALAHMPARTLITGLRQAVWLLDDSLRTLALGLPPEAFGEDRAAGLVALADLDWNEGRYGEARARAAAARPLLEHEVEQRPADDAPQRTLAEDYAYLGRCAEAVQLRVRLRIADRYEPKVAEHIDFAYDRLKLAVTCGDSAEAVAWADTLIHTPGQVTRAWVRLHPAFAPLRGRPDFQRLLAGK
jgi:predicted Zn-dependent protease